MFPLYLPSFDRVTKFLLDSGACSGKNLALITPWFVVMIAISSPFSGMSCWLNCFGSPQAVRVVAATMRIAANATKCFVNFFIGWG